MSQSPTLTSQRSGSSASIATHLAALALGGQIPPRPSARRRRAHRDAQSIADGLLASPRSSRAAAARGSPGCRHIRRCGGCSAARGTASAGSRGRHRIDDVEAGLRARAARPRAASAGGRGCPALSMARACTGSTSGRARQRRPDRRLAAVEVRGRDAAMPELEPASAPCACTASVIAGERAGCPASSQSRHSMKGAVVGGRMDLEHSSVQTTRPAALGLHAAHGGAARSDVDAHAVAMRHLVEAVAGRHRPDPHRLEQDVVTRIPHTSSDSSRSTKACPPLSCSTARYSSARWACSMLPGPHTTTGMPRRR